jgi:hypothetical protein
MFTLAGYPLLGDNQLGEIYSFIHNFIPIYSYMPWIRKSFPGFGLMGLAYPNSYGAEPWFRINKYRHPSLACRWSFGHFIADSDTVGQIAAMAYNQNGSYNTVPLVLGNPEGSSQGPIFPGETVTTQVYVLPPTPLSGIRGATGQYKSLYLLTTVDKRYFWWYKNIGNISISSSTTWASLYQTIGTALGITITTDDINAAYLQPSIQAYSLPYEPVPVVLDSVATNVGQRICVSLIDGSVLAQNYNTALAAINSDFADHPQRMVLSGGQRFASPL